MGTELAFSFSWNTIFIIKNEFEGAEFEGAVVGNLEYMMPWIWYPELPEGKGRERREKEKTGEKGEGGKGRTGWK
jgi:hypothetical protein